MKERTDGWLGVRLAPVSCCASMKRYYFDGKITKIVYTSGSPPGVCVPLGVRKKLEGVRKNVKFTDAFCFGGTRAPKG